MSSILDLLRDVVGDQALRQRLQLVSFLHQLINLLLFNWVVGHGKFHNQIISDRLFESRLVQEYPRLEVSILDLEPLL